MDPALQELLAEGAPDDEVAVVLRLDPGLPAPAGVRLVARFGDIATGRMPRGAIPAVRADAGVLSMKAARPYRADDDAQAAEGAPIQLLEGGIAEDDDLAPREGDQRRPPELPETGRGVIVAHVDWGADIAHADFRHADGRTRFAALWDQGAAYDPAEPNRYGYGRIHRTAQIDRALQADDPYAALGYHPARGKPAGGSHGSHTLGISAGNGLAGGPQGMAPEATLVFVDMSTQQQLPGAGLGNSAALLEALDFIAAIAAELGAPGAPLPVVVNASLGSQAGQHDGKTLTEQAMDAFLCAAPGRAIVQSTGNYHGRGIHAAGLLRPGADTVLDLLVAPAHPPHELDLWYPGPDRMTVEVCGPAGMVPVPAAPGQTTTLQHEGRPVGRVYHRRGDPNNGDHQVALFLDAEAPAGAWALRLQGDDVVDGRYHAWVERGPGGGAAQARFAPGDDSPCCTLGTICNGLRTIAVGAVDAHLAGHPLAPFSSGGPTRDGRGKPDLLAAGARVLSVRSAAADGLPQPSLMRMSGTSMAAPCVAGAVALMFAAAPRPLAIHETRRLLLATAMPAEPEADPVARWRQGVGHLDTAAAVAAARAVAADAAAPEPSDIHPPLLRSAPTMTSTPTAEDLLPAEADSPASMSPPCGCGAAGAATTLSEAGPGLDEADPMTRDHRMGSPGWRGGGAVSPFQIQLPIGGGAPSLALPIGGPRSPLAFSVPLGGPAPAPAAAAPAPVPAPPVPATPMAPTTPGGVPLPTPVMGQPDAPLPTLATVPAAAFDPPVLVAGDVAITMPAEATEAEPAARVPAHLALLAAADALCGDAGCQAIVSSSQWLRHLLGSDGRFSQRGDGGAAPSATALFNAFVHADADPLRHHQQARYREHLLPLARPGERVDALRLQPGDLLIRVALGQGYGHAAVVASPVLARHDELPAWAWQAPGGRRPREGHYLQVVEVLPRVRSLSERWARRVADARGRMLPGTLLLRSVPLGRGSLSSGEDLMDTLAEDANADIRWLQQALNQVVGTHLAVDGDAGPATRRALRTFQQHSGLAVDGVASQRTLAALREAMSRSGGGGTSSAATGSPCTTLSRFPQGRDTLSAAHRAQLVDVARRILRDGNSGVLVTGFASSEGADIDNFVLGMRRAIAAGDALREALEHLRPGGSARVAIVPMSRGESEQIEGGVRELNRRVTVCPQLRLPTPVPQPTQPTSTSTFRVVAKSFIARIGSLVGSLDCELSTAGDIAAGVLLGPIGGYIVDRLAPHASNVAFELLAKATDLAFSENPADDRIFTSPPPNNKGYRLFSHAQLQAQCRGAELLGVSLAGTLETDSGKECLPQLPVCMQAPPLTVDQPFVTRRLDSARIAFRWGVKGRPPGLPEVGLEAVCMRDSRDIWHQVDGVIDCSSGSPQVTRLVLSGSRFPSHRAWVDGTQVQNIPQGPLSGLWDGAPGDPSRVR